MRFIRRLLDRRPSVVVLAVCSLCAAAGASCSSSEEDGPLLPSDSLDAGAGPETSEPAVDAEVDGPPLRDAAAFDGGSRPVVCTSQPCAKSLVTTLPTMVLSGPSTIAPAEGFCALLDDGTVACWGANNDGQLGRGDDAGITESAIPARVVGLSNIVELAHNCARSASGDVWCWGLGVYVRGDAGAYASEPAPVRVPIPPAKRIGLGRLVGCAATDDGLLCWGQNAFLQIDPIPRGGLLPPTPVDLPPGAPIRDVVVGDATFVIREDGSTWSWGRSPPLGRVSSLDPDPHPAPTGLAAISSLDLTNTSACATSKGVGYCWGAIDTTGLPEDYPPSPLVNALPKPVVAPEPLVQIATTETSATSTPSSRTVRPQRWCAVGVSGDVYCWGLNSHGQAGDGTKNHAYHAVKVEGLPAPAAEVKTMPLSTCALLTTGKVYCWGNNFYGQLGTGTIKGGSLTPQEVALP